MFRHCSRSPELFAADPEFSRKSVMPQKKLTTPPQPLTNQVLQKLPAGAIARDSKVRGMFAECTKTGVRSFKVQADLRSGLRNGEARKPVTVRMTLGHFPNMTIDQARAEAAIVLGQIKKGIDPRVKLAGAEAASEAPSGGWTVAIAYDRYVSYLKRQKRSDRTLDDHATHFRYLFDPSDPEAPLALEDTGKRALAVYGWAKRNKGDEPLPPPVAKRKRVTVVPGAPALAMSDWRELPLTSLTRLMVSARHEFITERHGPIIANKVIKTLRSWLNNAIESGVDCPGNLTAIKFNAERAKQRSMHLEQLADWYKRLQRRPNPLRRIMYEFALLSGLRPANVARIQLSWIDLARQVIKFPEGVMKKRVEFHLPLSEYMVGLVRQALEARRIIVSKESDYLFPTYSPEGTVIPTATWHEKKDLEKETGHFLRHTYSNMAKLIGPENGVSVDDKKALMAHALEGVEGVYVYQPVQFRRLVQCQEIVTEFILKEMRPGYLKPTKVNKVTPAAGLEAFATGLLDRKGLEEALRVHSSDVDRMLEQGMPMLLVVGAERFNFKEVLEWLGQQEKPKKLMGKPGTKRGRPAE